MISEGKKAWAGVPRAERIGLLNDRLRATAEGGVVMVTRCVRNLPGFCPIRLMAALANYDAFDADNDPHGERDFGDLELFGADLLWKIDYYDVDLQYGSDDPADPAVTTRVLTVMEASEY